MTIKTLRWTNGMRRTRVHCWFLLPAIAAATSGCGGEPSPAAQASAQTARVPAVGVVTPVVGDVARTITQPATIQGIEEATIYAKTSGYLKQLLVDKGDRVRAGQLLAIIDSPELAHQQDQARASFEQNVAAIRGVEATRGRAQADVLQARASVGRYEAEVRQAEAAVARARAEAARVESRLPKLEAEVAEAEANVQQAIELQSQAQADVARGQQLVRAAQARLKAAQSALRKAESDSRLQKLTYDRLKAIQDKDSGLIPAQDVDVARTRLEAAQSDVETQRNRVDAERSEVAGAEQQLEGVRRQVAAAGRKVEALRGRAKAAREEIQVCRREIEAAQAQVRVMESQVESAKQQVTVASAQQRAVSEQVPIASAQIEVARKQAQSARSALATASSLQAYTRVVAPFDGVVTERISDPGSFVQSAGANQASARGLVRLVRDRSLRVMIPVPEVDIPMIRRGQAAEIIADAYPKKPFHGTVTRFASAVDARSRTMLTEVDIPNPDGRLRPGMYARVRLTLAIHQGALSIPSEAIMGPEDKRFVYVVKDGHAHRTPVTVGIDDGKTAQITSGIREGDPVVVVGRDTLIDGAAVKSEPAPAKK